MERENLAPRRKTLARLRELSHTLFKWWKRRGSDPKFAGVNSGVLPFKLRSRKGCLIGDVINFSRWVTSPILFSERLVAASQAPASMAAA